MFHGPGLTGETHTFCILLLQRMIECFSQDAQTVWAHVQQFLFYNLSNIVVFIRKAFQNTGIKSILLLVWPPASVSWMYLVWFLRWCRLPWSRFVAWSLPPTLFLLFYLFLFQASVSIFLVFDFWIFLGFVWLCYYCLLRFFCSSPLLLFPWSPFFFFSVQLLLCPPELLPGIAAFATGNCCLCHRPQMPCFRNLSTEKHSPLRWVAASECPIQSVSCCRMSPTHFGRSMHPSKHSNDPQVASQLQRFSNTATPPQFLSLSLLCHLFAFFDLQHQLHHSCFSLSFLQQSLFFNLRLEAARLKQHHEF